jgi:hypothetical protein
VRYAWRNESLFPTADAQAVGDRLEALAAEHGGVTKETILAEAADRRSPLHPLIERDDAKAADLYRTKQTGSVMSQLVLVKGARKTATKAFVYVQPTPHSRKAYVPLQTAMRQSRLREQVVEQALRELSRWFDRYGSLKEMRPVKGQINDLRHAIESELLAAVS